jgi:hypothetical protein
MDLLVRRYNDDPENAIENAVGKTDGFIYTDEKSREIINLWLDGKEEKANKELKEYVSRIASKAS